MSDDDILMRGGTEEDIATYAHDVGNACMYPDYPCEICEARERAKKEYPCGENLRRYDKRNRFYMDRWEKGRGSRGCKINALG